MESGKSGGNQAGERVGKDKNQSREKHKNQNNQVHGGRGHGPGFFFILGQIFTKGGDESRRKRADDQKLKNSIRDNKGGVIHIQQLGLGAKERRDKQAGFDQTDEVGQAISGHNDKSGGENMALAPEENIPHV